MPIWLGVLSALGSGLVGTAVGTLLRIRHERDADLRPYLIDAAQQFGEAAGAALRHARTTIDHRFAFEPDPDEDREEQWEEWFDKETVELIRDADREIGAAASKLLRLRLLFGEESGCDEPATQLIQNIAGAISVAKAVPADPEFLASALLDEAEVDLQNFHRAARKQIRKPEINSLVAMRRRRKHNEAVRQGREGWMAANVPGYKAKVRPAGLKRSARFFAALQRGQRS